MYFNYAEILRNTKGKHTLNFVPFGTFQKNITVTHMVRKDINFITPQLAIIIHGKAVIL